MLPKRSQGSDNVALIQWNDRFNVGVRSLDLQHRQLIDVLNELHAALSQGRGKDVLTGLLARLASYAWTHLQHEERLLAAHRYPDFAAHKAEHDSYLARMRELEARSHQGGTAVTLELMQFLKGWWTGHILESDRKYSAHLSARQAA